MTDIKHSTPNEVAGKVALITGAASGIGKAIALLLHARGAKVIAEDINPEVEALARPGLVPLVADITQDGAAERAVALAVEQFGRLDILVNNAGRQQFRESLEELTTEDFDATFKTNVYAPFWITKAALRHLKASSVIINTSSVQAVKPSPVLLDYAQTKACLAVFTKSLAKQLGPKGIRVNAVAPGPYWTVLQSSGGQPMEKVKEFGGDTPLGRPGQPVEIAPLYVTLASDECSFTSGQVWCSDGGDGVI